jgi:Pretoxin HINT domain
MTPARRWLAFLSAAVAVPAAVLAVVLPTAAASASAVPAAGDGVGALHPVMILTVGASRQVRAVQGRCETASQPQIVSGACVAAEDTGDLADAATCGGMSFTAGTMVLLASGAAIPISQLKAGDKVLATNVKTGKTFAEPVTAVLVHHDTDRYDLTIKTAHGTAVIQTTSSHRFYDQTTSRWTRAAALSYGDTLRTSDGTVVLAAGGYTPKNAAGWMWDLTVPGGGDHDFYIDVAATAVLVHNCPVGQPFDDDQRALIQLAKELRQIGGVSQEDGETLSDWADEYDLDGHGPAVHPGRPGFGGNTPHINIGPIKHIPVIP